MPFLVNAMAAVLAAVVVQPAPDPSPPAPAPKPAVQTNTVAAVVVTGEAAPVQTSIDRRSYSLGKDIQATSGSVADALRNVPSVQVDLQGQLTLRGDANVTILVDGKPAGAFEGAGRADALQQLPADQIEWIEVMTNPSAAFDPNGSAGVINLITRKSRGAGSGGSAYVTAGSAGLKRAGLNFGYNSKAFSLTGALAGNYQRNKSVVLDHRSTLDPITGRFEDHDIELDGRNLTRGPNGRLNASYALTPKDQLTGGLNYNELLTYGSPFYRYRDGDVGDSDYAAFSRQAQRRFIETDTGASAGWRHSFADEGRQLSIDALQNRTRSSDVQYFDLLDVSTPVPLELNDQYANRRHSELKADYRSPLPGAAKLDVGYEWKNDDNLAVADVAQGSTRIGLVRDPSLSYRYDYQQSINALYVTYEKPFGDLTMQAGLRLEDTRIEGLEQTSGDRNGQHYFRAYPTLHLSYKLDDQRKLTASYSERVQRPPPIYLFPLKIYFDPKNYEQGNPDLAPQQTRSFELGYEQRRGPTLFTANAYYRDNKNQFTPIERDQGDGVFLTTIDNLGSSRTAGLELSANGALSKALTYNANADLYWNQINAANIGFPGVRSAYGVNGRLNLNWQARANDLLQLNLSAQGKQLFAQAVDLPNWTLNAGWRHKINDKVTATLSAQDLLNTNRNRSNFDTPTLVERYRGRYLSRAVLLRLDYRFGGAGAKPAADPGFDYGGGAGP